MLSPSSNMPKAYLAIVLVLMFSLANAKTWMDGGGVYRRTQIQAN